MVLDTRVALVSTDGHVGPRTVDLRPYCEQAHLEEFDAFNAGMAPLTEMLKAFFTATGEPPDGASDEEVAHHRRKCMVAETKGHYDPYARLADLDREGIAAETLYNASQNGELAPFERIELLDHFIPAGTLPDPTLDQRALGDRIFNRWLADFCSVAPQRFIGLARIPYWDIDASIRELEWAAEHGLRGVNFPAPRAGIPAYSNPAWDRFWAAAADLDLVLSTHAGGAPITGIELPSPMDGMFTEATLLEIGWFSRRGLWWMVVGGVFERFPALKLVLAEVPGYWWGEIAEELDGIYARNTDRTLPRPPSDYMRSNCFVGASFMSRMEVEFATRTGWTNNFMWGSDYPHIEGTFGYTRLSLNKALEGVDEATTRKLAGLNAANVYGVDLESLESVVAGIGPTLHDLTKPFDEAAVPVESKFGLAFRNTKY